MNTVTYRNNTYTGARKDLIIALRKNHNLSYEQIGELIGISRQAVNKSLSKHAPELQGQRSFPKLEKAETFESATDEELAQELNTTVNNVTKHRRKHGKKKSVINVSSRQRRFIRETFGRKYILGKAFHLNLESALSSYLTDLEIARLVNFYIKGGEDSAYFRTHRAYVRNKLLEIIQQEPAFIQVMLDKEVISEKG